MARVVVFAMVPFAVKETDSICCGVVTSSVNEPRGKVASTVQLWEPLSCIRTTAIGSDVFGRWQTRPL